MQWCQVEDTVAVAIATVCPASLTTDDYRRMARVAIKAIHGLQLAGLIERCGDD